MIARWTATAGSTMMLLAFSAGAIAQDTKSPTAFQQLFSNPTGRNGYEEIVAGCDLLKSSDLLQDIQAASTETTLEEKRRALGDPPVKRGLALVRVGLVKPLSSIHPNIDTDTLFPEFALFRHAARTLMIEEYVRLADGDVSGAIDSLRDCLRLGFACGSDTVIATLVKVAVDAIALRCFADHFRQLSARDCDHVMALAREWMTLPDPAIAALLGEKRLWLKTWQKCRSNPDTLLSHMEEIGGVSDDRKPDANAAGYMQAVQKLATNTPGYTALIDSLSTKTAHRIDAEIARLQRPTWDREPPPNAKDDTIAGYLLASFLPILSQMSDKYMLDRTAVQLLGVNAAVLRYLWEYDRLPDRLEDLRFRDLIIDPCTGKALEYKRTGPRTFEVWSAGPYDRGDDERPPSGKRIPIYLPRKRT
jgi:hypothetical protein